MLVQPNYLPQVYHSLRKLAAAVRYYHVYLATLWLMRTNTMTNFINGDTWDEEEGKSKSQIKREMHALQELGEELVALSPAARAKLPLDEELTIALVLADKLSKKHEALRRHIQFIGRLMRDRDLKELEQGLALLRNTNQAATRQFHKIEQLRDKMLEDNDVVTAFIADHPTVDTQQLRQLIRNAKKEQEKQLPPKAYRELFQLIKPLILKS